ncbi:alpha-crystallin B chain isoform X2 [Strongylocentrotus purpuratus]|uniref:SHSP domain-containing protein n=1 Tax=Strongylocentrotus purpuratus TaxID=7668 RepID=A0A7M7RCI9_STRPU|nr:alpha-crystallin B chain isoform X2 [Strongylocentrotus purpuratus]|eukprot:XP_784059.3 PREDICTED: alpha-crystallin B chain-like isoform X2 [Strongylocentrotus purpuratus]
MERKVITKHSSSRRRFTDDGGWEQQPMPSRLGLEQRFGDVVHFDDDLGDFPAHPQSSQYYVTSRPTATAMVPSRRMEVASMPPLRMGRTPIPVSTGDVMMTDTDFKVAVDVSNFDPEDIEIKIVESELTVHGKHMEKQDDHGKISREFTRRYTLPPDVDPTTVTSSLGQDGILAISAPRNPPKPKNQNIPIKVESKPAISGAKK